MEPGGAAMSGSGHNAVSSNMQDDAVIKTVILRTPHSGMVRHWRSARLQTFINAQWNRVSPTCRHLWKTNFAGNVPLKIEEGNRLHVGVGVQVQKAPWRRRASRPTRCGRGSCSLFTVQSGSQSSQSSACSTAHIPTTACATAPGSLLATGNGPSLGTSIRRAPHRWTQCSCSAPTPRRVRHGRDPVGLAVPKYNTGLKRGQCTLVRMSGPPCTRRAEQSVHGSAAVGMYHLAASRHSWIARTRLPFQPT